MQRNGDRIGSQRRGDIRLDADERSPSLAVTPYEDELKPSAVTTLGPAGTGKAPLQGEARGDLLGRAVEHCLCIGGRRVGGADVDGDRGPP